MDWVKSSKLPMKRSLKTRFTTWNTTIHCFQCWIKIIHLCEEVIENKWCYGRCVLRKYNLPNSSTDHCLTQSDLFFIEKKTDPTVILFTEQRFTQSRIIQVWWSLSRSSSSSIILSSWPLRTTGMLKQYSSAQNKQKKEASLNFLSSFIILVFCVFFFTHITYLGSPAIILTKYE